MSREKKGYALKRQLGLVPYQYDKNRRGYGVVQHSTQLDRYNAGLVAKERQTSGFPPPIARVRMTPLRGGGYRHG